LSAAENRVCPRFWSSIGESGPAAFASMCGGGSGVGSWCALTGTAGTCRYRIWRAGICALSGDVLPIGVGLLLVAGYINVLATRLGRRATRLARRRRRRLIIQSERHQGRSRAGQREAENEPKRGRERAVLAVIVMAVLLSSNLTLPFFQFYPVKVVVNGGQAEITPKRHKRHLTGQDC
jgi:hypothetical protein